MYRFCLIHHKGMFLNDYTMFAVVLSSQIVIAESIAEMHLLSLTGDDRLKISLATLGMQL